MSKKTITVDSAEVYLRMINEKQLVEVIVADVKLARNWSFYVPMESLELNTFVPGDILRARMLRDFNVKINYYSSTVKAD